MQKSYHINSKGLPSECKARKGNCPFGSSSFHYKNPENAQIAADMQNELKHGILFSESRTIVKVSESKKDLDYINNRLERHKEMEIEDKCAYYYSRSRSSTKVENYVVNNEKTRHYQEDRQAKEKLLVENVGAGSVVGHYKVDHIVKEGVYGEQIIEVHDTGQIKIYNLENGRLITTFIPTRERMEVMMLRAGDIPNQDWLNEVQKTKDVTDKEWKKIKHLHENKNTKSSFKKNEVNKFRASEQKKTESTNKKYGSHIKTDVNSSSEDISKRSPQSTDKRPVQERKPTQNKNPNKSTNNIPVKDNKSSQYKDRKPSPNKPKKEPQYNKHGILTNN